MKSHGISAGLCRVAAMMLAGVAAAVAAAPFDSATVTRVENRVLLGEVRGGQASARRPVAVSQAIKANNFVETASESRAELQFKDSSLVRVGQNSIFSFESGTRTLSLQKGEMLFHIAPGTGGGTIKTAALTAAITGTLGKVSPGMIAFLNGSGVITFKGRKTRVPAGYAAMVIKGELRIFKFDPREATKGKLYAMGPLPELPGLEVGRANAGLRFPRSEHWNAIDSAVGNPFFNRNFVPGSLAPDCSCQVPMVP
jgi:hypothetical protein